MTREEIMQDMKFREACSKYGIYWRNCEVYGELIVLNTPITDLYILMDKNYNTIDVEYIDLDVEDLEDFVEEKFETYCNYTDILPFGNKFYYPFEEYTLKNIIDLANRIEVMETNHGHSLRTRINGVWYDRDSKENDEYFKVLSYVKFLGEEIKQYFLLSYHMQAMEFAVPDIYTYVRTITGKLLDYISNCTCILNRPIPSEFLKFIGQSSIETDMSGILSDALNLLLNEEGYEVDKENPNKVKIIDNNKDRPDHSKLAVDLLRILDVTDEELKQTEEENRTLRKEKNSENFKCWLNRISAKTE